MEANIPGQPKILIINMPGPGGVKAANYVFVRAASSST